MHSPPCLLPLWVSVWTPLVGCTTASEKRTDSANPADDVDPDALDTRSFSLGFTPWPYAATLEAVADTQAKVAAHGDLWGTWLDNGIPWAEALAASGYTRAVDTELADKAAAVPAGKVHLVSIGLLDSSRTRLATDWDGAPRTGRFSELAFDHPDVQAAATSWALHVTETLSPDYLNIALEASDVAAVDPAAWPALQDTICTVYDTVKTHHPDLPTFFSVALKHPDGEEMDHLRDTIPAAAACTDLAGVSTYGYAFYGHDDAGDPTRLPPQWLSAVDDLLPGKPLAIAETAWPAEDLVIPEYGIHTPATAADQAAYVDRLLSELHERDALFAVWFAVVDYDTLWEDTLGEAPLAAIWRDTGLYDESGAARPALDRWESWRVLPVE